MGKIVAFFDIDGTLFRNSLMIQHFRTLTKFEIIDPAIWHTQIKKVYDEWEARYGDFEEYLEVIAKAYLDALKGVDKTYMEIIAAKVIELNGDMVYKYSRDRIEWHKSKGHKVFFISGSPDFLVSKMAEKYGVDEYRGTLYMVDAENKFTGEIRKLWDSANKEKVIHQLIENYDVDLLNSFSYGDTTGDLSMLKMVGNPVAINPNKALFLAIREDLELKNKIDIIVERKNVIYKLDPDTEIM